MALDLQLIDQSPSLSLPVRSWRELRRRVGLRRLKGRLTQPLLHQTKFRFQGQLRCHRGRRDLTLMRGLLCQLICRHVARREQR